jgi:hypothetical protein
MLDRFKKLLGPPQKKPTYGCLEEALDPLWLNHMRHLTHRTIESRKEIGDSVAIELLLATEPSEDLQPPWNQFRIDCCHPGPVDPAVDAKFIDILTPLMQPSLASFELPGVQFRLLPFFWGGCRLLLDGETAPEFEAELRRWFEFWLDADEKRFTDDRFELQQVVHSVRPTRGDNGSWTLEIDFGSASPSAFLDLVVMIGRRFRGQVLVDAFFKDEPDEMEADAN